MYGNRRATRDLDVGREGVKLCSVQRPRGQRGELQQCRVDTQLLPLRWPVTSFQATTALSPKAYSTSSDHPTSHHLPPPPVPRHSVFIPPKHA